MSNNSAINIVFEEDMPSERIAEFIEILSKLYGEEFDIVSVERADMDGCSDE